jgi:predicted membrane channel-forming protein YqfA (hemolysin III family)
LDFQNGGLIYLFVFFSTILFLFSTLYHILNSHSNEVCACCYKLDLMGIMFELVSATVASLYYMFHEYDTLKKIYIYVFLVIGVLTITISLFDYFISAKLNLFLMLLYASLFFISFLSCVHWSVIANLNEVRIISKYVLCGYLSLFIGFIFFFAKFPESCFQSITVDYFFQSHSMWHISTSLCVLFYYLMLYNYYQLLYGGKPGLVI